MGSWLGVWDYGKRVLGLDADRNAKGCFKVRCCLMCDAEVFVEFRIVCTDTLGFVRCDVWYGSSR